MGQCGSTMVDQLKDAANDLGAGSDSPERAVFTIDLEGVIRKWNDDMTLLTGFQRDAVVGKPATSLQCPGCDIPTCPFGPQDFAALAQNPGITEETCLRHASGTIFPVFKTGNPILTPNRDVAGAEVHLEPLP